jgi:hypothetical protein
VKDKVIALQEELRQIDMDMEGSQSMNLFCLLFWLLVVGVTLLSLCTCVFIYVYVTMFVTAVHAMHALFE